MASKTLRAAVLAGAALACPMAPAQATNGYFSEAFSTQSKGMAGAGLTTAEGAMGLAQNPALGVAIGNSAEADFSAFFFPRSATFSGAAVTASGTYESGSSAVPILSMGVNTLLDDKTSFGVVMFGNGGMNTDYTTMSMMGSSGFGVNIAQAFLAANVSRTVFDGLTVGVAPVLAMQYFRAWGLQAFSGMSISPANVTDNGDDISFGGGVRAGVVWDALPWMSVAATYQSRMWMTPFSAYKGLFAEGGSFDIPPTVSAGVNFKPMKDLEVLLEWERIFYGDIASISNTGLLTNVGTQMLGMDGGLGFGWKDVDIFRVAAQWHMAPEWTLRAGYSHSTDFTDPSQILFNTLSPATITDHLSVGFTYNFTPGWLLTAAYTYSFENDLSGTIAAAFGGGTETVRMEQHEVSVGFTYKF